MASIRDLLDEDAQARLSPEPLPERITPMLATPHREPFEHPGWLYERKLDGQRTLLTVRDGRAELRSRHGDHLDATFPELIDAAEAADLPDLIVDGEVVALSGEATSFARLQQRMGIRDAATARRSPVAVHAYLFDLLHLGGVSTRGLRLRERKRLLREVIGFEDPLRYCDHRNADGVAYLEEACADGWEGLIAKDATSRYVSGRSTAWLKFKYTARQELVIGGFTAPRGSRTGFGALLVGYHDGQDLRYAGKVGTGYDQATLEHLSRLLAERGRSTSPFAERISDRDVRFVTPELVAAVTFLEWTDNGRLRHPVFEGLRTDKDAREVVREAVREPAPEAGTRSDEPIRTRTAEAPPPRRDREVKRTNLDKVLFPDGGITKGELLDYYERVTETMFPYLADRPVAIKRHPDGIGTGGFYQKNIAEHFPAWLGRVRVDKRDGDRTDNLIVNEPAALLYLANLAAIEFHQWLVRADALDRPDQLVFDLDPPGQDIDAARAAARRVRDVLDELELPHLLKTSGSKGYHVHVLIDRDGEVDGRGFAADVAQLLALRHADELTVKFRKQARRGRVLIDHFRNRPGQTVVAPYSVRALPGAPVSTPIAWEELGRTDPQRFTIRNLFRRLGQREDPWAEPWARAADGAARLAAARVQLDEALAHAKG